jgi:hypothetical protein
MTCLTADFANSLKEIGQKTLQHGDRIGCPGQMSLSSNVLQRTHLTSSLRLILSPRPAPWLPRSRSPQTHDSTSRCARTWQAARLRRRSASGNKQILVIVRAAIGVDAAIDGRDQQTGCLGLRLAGRHATLRQRQHLEVDVLPKGDLSGARVLAPGMAMLACTLGAFVLRSRRSRGSTE